MAFGPGISGRIDRLRSLVAQFIKTGITPESNVFGQRVYEVCIGEFGVRKQTAQQYAEALGVSWRRYRWVNWVKGNSYLSQEEKEDWIRKHSEKRSLKELNKTFITIKEESS